VIAAPVIWRRRWRSRRRRWRRWLIQWLFRVTRGQRSQRIVLTLHIRSVSTLYWSESEVLRARLIRRHGAGTYRVIRRFCSRRGVHPNQVIDIKLGSVLRAVDFHVNPESLIETLLDID